MLLGPVFSAEMVTSARRTRYFVVRLLYALALLLAYWVVYESNVSHRQILDIHVVARVTAYFFQTFTILQLLAVVLLGPAMAAGTIAIERERRTIEYLFVSTLTDSEIVFGKLAARLVQICCLLLVGLPVLALAMLLGGIAPEALLALFVITLSTVLAVSIFSITVSVWSNRARDAVTRAYLVLLVLLVGPLFVAEIPGPVGSLLAPFNGQLLLANPFWVVGWAGVLSGTSSTAAADAWAIIGAMVRNHLVVSVAGVILATLAVRRVHLRQSGTAAKRRRRLLQFLRPEPGNNPMLWKELFAEPAASRLGLLGRLAVAIIVLGVVGTSLYQFLWFVFDASGRGYALNMFIGYTMATTGFLGCGSLLLIAARAAASITSEKERESWSSLISTSLTPSDIILAKTLGSIFAMRGFLLLLAFVWGLAVLAAPGFLLAVPFLLAPLLVTAWYAASLGVMFSLWCRNSLRAMAATLAVLIFVGGGYWFCCMPLMITGSSSEKAVALVAAPWIPYLLVFPGIVYMEGGRILENDPEFAVAYIFGIILYLIAGASLFAGAVGNFDVLCGRTGGIIPTRRRPESTDPERVVLGVADEEEQS